MTRTLVSIYIGKQILLNLLLRKFRENGIISEVYKLYFF